MTTNTVWRHGLLLAAAALSGACGDDRDNGVKVDEFSGATEDLLRTTLQKHGVAFPN